MKHRTRRLLSVFLSATLALGQLPATALAESSAESPAAPSGLPAAPSSAPAHALATESDVSATFTDTYLYEALDAQLIEQEIEHTANAASKTITVSAAEAAKVTTLNLGYSQISDLTGIGALASFPNLTKLQLDHNSLKDTAAAPLAALTGLTYLDLYENNLNDWTFLEQLTNLEHLNLGLNKRGGLTRTALKKLKKLKWLDFSFPNSEDVNQYNLIIECVSELPDLEYLDLCNWSFNSLNGIEKLTKLKTLIINENYAHDLSPLLGCTALEELHVAYNRMYWQDNIGLGSLLNDDGSLKLPNLKKLEMWSQEERSGQPNFLNDATKDAHKHVNALYQLHKQGKLELGFDYHWIDELVAMQPHTDSNGVKYIAYDDFGARCREGSDDFNAIRAAHAYANDHGCEVRATVGEGAQAAKDKVYHYYRLYDRKDECYAYTSVDWQGATIVIHDEEIDWHYRVSSRPFLVMRPSPAGYATQDKRLVSTMRTFDVTSTKEEDKLTLNTSSLPLTTTATSIKGVSDQIDATIAELNAKGYSRYFVELFDSTTDRYRRGYVYHYEKNPQWDAVIVDADGTIQRFNAAKLAGDETPEGSYIPPDPLPLQWQFDNITKVVIEPIAPTKAHIKNARFITMPLSSKKELPKERNGSSYFHNLAITGTNFELANITQTVGIAETGYDNNHLSGNYVGFINLKDCADVDMHDCYTWDRICTHSTYGFNTERIMCAHYKNVGDSNYARANDWGNHGGNFGKHALWEGITLGRIDQHTGCYDMCVRDSRVGSLSLTGQGPLTVERTTVVGGDFLNLRGDYGSTWDGVAHIIDCTHFPLLESSGEPNGFAASTPEMSWNFGYPQKFPELHIKNFTIDCSKYTRFSGTRYRISYGIAANYLNGLNSMYRSTFWPGEDYWPDTLEVDGLNITGWREYMGCELHVLSPLYMYGKPATQARSGAWTIKNVKYYGEDFVPATFEGSDELAGPGDITASPSKRVTADFTSEQVELVNSELEKSDIVIAYQGDEPRIILRGKHIYLNEEWIGAYPYYVEHRGDTEVAYYSGRELMNQWRKVVAAHLTTGEKLLHIEIVPEAQTGSRENENLSGDASILHVRLAKTHVLCEHEWGEWTVTRAPTCYGAGEERCVCTKDSSHVRTQELEALGHNWRAPSYLWSDDNKSCTAKIVCQNDATHVETETVETTHAVLREPTETESGEAMYTATFSNELFATQTKRMEIEPDGSERPETPGSPAGPESPAEPGTPGSPDEPGRPDWPRWSWHHGAWRWETSPGAYAVGWIWDGADWYYADLTGAAVSGWLWDSGEWYYLNERDDGRRCAMEVGWVPWSGAWYWLNPDPGCGPRGRMLRSRWVADRGLWYLLAGWGGALTGWQWDGSAWYYLDTVSCAMRTNTWTAWGYAGADGRWVG